MERRTHDWSIDEREYARHEARRGRRHAFERIRPASTALVVVDLVPFFVEELPTGRGVVPHVNRIAAALRAAGGVVAWVLPGHETPTSVDVELLGAEIATRYATAGGEGPLRTRLWHELEPDDGDLFVEKTARSAFFPGRSTLHDDLTARGVDTVLVAGAVTNVCCESTVRDASTLGYRVVMVADANAAPRDEEHNATLRTVYRSFGDVRPTVEVLALIEAGEGQGVRSAHTSGRPRVLMMCGPGGAGKTTYAKGLEREGWTRLSFEVEFWERGITTMPSADVVADVAADLKARLLRRVAAGDDVVLDFGFWYRRQRDEFRALLAPHGVVPETVYIATSLETILSRVGDRHGTQADDWPLTEQAATEYVERFEPPTPEEGPLVVVR